MKPQLVVTISSVEPPNLFPNPSGRGWCRLQPTWWLIQCISRFKYISLNVLYKSRPWRTTFESSKTTTSIRTTSVSEPIMLIVLIPPKTTCFSLHVGTYKCQLFKDCMMKQSQYLLLKTFSSLNCYSDNSFCCNRCGYNVVC